MCQYKVDMVYCPRSLCAKFVYCMQTVCLQADFSLINGPWGQIPTCHIITGIAWFLVTHKGNTQRADFLFRLWMFWPLDFPSDISLQEYMYPQI